MANALAGNGSRVAALGLACLLGWGLFGPADARGATHYWDPNGDGSGGVGTWDTSTLNWSASPAGGSDYAWPNAPADTASFAGTAGIVTVSEPINVGGITAGVDGYVITGGTLTFGADATIYVTNGWDNKLTIDSNITMAGFKLTLDVGGNGRSQLRLGGTNDIGSFAILGTRVGYLVAKSAAAIGTVPIDLGPNGGFRVAISNIDTLWSNDFNAGGSNGLGMTGSFGTAEFSGDITGAGSVGLSVDQNQDSAYLKLTRAAAYSGTGKTVSVYASSYNNMGIRIGGANCLSRKIVDFLGNFNGYVYLDVDCTIGGLTGMPRAGNRYGWIESGAAGDRQLTVDVVDGVYTTSAVKLRDGVSVLTVVKLGTGVQRITPNGGPNTITGDVLVGSVDTDGGFLVLGEGAVFDSTAGAVTVGSASGTGTGTLVGNGTIAKATTVTANGTIVAGDLMQATDELNNIIIDPASVFWTVTVLKVDDPASEGYDVEFQINSVVVSTDTQVLAGASFDYPPIELMSGDTLDVTLTSLGAADYNLELYNESAVLLDSSSEPPATEPDTVGGTYVYDNRFSFGGALTIDGEYRCYLGDEATAAGFSQLVQTGVGTFSVGAGATFTLGLVNGLDPENGSAFWKQAQSWAVIDGASALTNFTFATQNLGSYAAGGFSLGYDDVNFDVTLDWTPVEVSVEATTSIAVEGSAPGVFTISRSAGSSPLTVQFTLSSAAVIPDDFSTFPVLGLGNSTLTFLQDESEILIEIIPFDDTQDEGSKQVGILILASTEYGTGGQIADAITIVDDDGPPQLFFLDKPVDGDTTVPRVPNPVLEWTVSGAATWYTVTVADNASFNTPFVDDVSVIAPLTSYEITDPLAYGGNYWWKVTAHNPTGPLPAQNNDFDFQIEWATPVVTIEWTKDALEPSTNGVFTLTRVNGDPADEVIVSYQVTGGAMAGVADTNYVALPGTVTFAPGSLTATITVQPMDDWDQLDQTVTVILSPAGAGEYTVGASPDNMATLTLYDDDLPPRSFDLTSPGSVAGTTGVLLVPTPVLQWEVAQGATSYLVELDEDPGVGSPFFSVQTTGMTSTSYTLPPFTVRGLTTYYWMVTASNVNGTKKANDEFIFQTEQDTVPPQVKSTTPRGGDNDVTVSTKVKVTFNEPMDKTTTELAVSMKDEFDTVWPGVASFSMNGMTLTFNPDVDLTEDVIYTVTVAATAEDLGGNTLDGDESGTEQGSPADDYTFTFTAEPPLAGLAAGDGCLPVGPRGTHGMVWIMLVLAALASRAAPASRLRS